VTNHHREQYYLISRSARNNIETKAPSSAVSVASAPNTSVGNLRYHFTDEDGNSTVPDGARTGESRDEVEAWHPGSTSRSGGALGREGRGQRRRTSAAAAAVETAAAGGRRRLEEQIVSGLGERRLGFRPGSMVLSHSSIAARRSPEI
jgi:hypothetical protein